MRTLFALLIALAVFLPAGARAAVPRITRAEYESRLTQAIDLLSRGQTDQARTQLGDVWEVSTDASHVTVVDLRPVQDLIKRNPNAAANVLREHRQALQATATPKTLPRARETLDKALKDAAEQQKANETLLDWLGKLLRRLFGGPREEQAAPVAEPPGRQVPWLTYVALAIGVAGVSVLGWNLMRTLGGNAGGENVALGAGRRATRPDRPATPEELWQMAGEQAAAGDYKEGLRLAHLALLQHLDRAGLLRYVPAQTNREHEWMLRRKQPELARTMHQLNDLVESRLYSGHGASAEDFRRGETLAQQLWREGDVASKSAQETTGASSSASSS